MNISPGQALLIIIENYLPIIPQNELFLNQLKKFYLDGAKNPEEQIELKRIFKNHENGALKDYRISYEKSVIDKDPTRRYFETHFAFQTLKYGLNNVALDRLTYHEGELRKFLAHYNAKALNMGKKTLEQFAADDQQMNKQYADYISRIGKNKTDLFNEKEGFSDEARTKIKLIIKCSYWAIQGAKCSHPKKGESIYPLNIYSKDLFSEVQRGKRLKKEEPQNVAQKKALGITENRSLELMTRNQHLGLMKGHMPLSQDDTIMAPSPITYPKASDQANYVDDAVWVKLNFYRLVHPYSNSISGTVLCQLKSLAFLQKAKIYPFSESEKDFKNYFKVFTSTLLFFSGGHSLFELVYPLQLPAVIKEFRSSGKENVDLKLNEASISNLFLSNSNPALTNALTAAINYNKLYLIKQRVLQSITSPSAEKEINNKRKRDDEIEQIENKSEINHSKYPR